MRYSIATLNQMTQAEFVAALGNVFEETPQVAEQAWNSRPFTDLADLHHKMLNVVKTMSQAEQIAFIQSHPDLGSKAKMAEASVQEQSEVGLDQLNPEEYACFQHLNQAYKAKFGFPFIVAVKNQTKGSILEAFDRRLHHEIAVEIQQALAEIAQITRFRLDNALL